MDDVASRDVEIMLRAAARRYDMNLDHTDLGAVTAIARRTIAAAAALATAVSDLPLRATDPAPR